MNDNKTYICIAVLVILVALYYLIDYQIKSTLKNEFKRIQNKKHKKDKLQKIRQQRLMRDMEMRRDVDQHDMDSYVDPAEEQRHEHDDEHEHFHHERARLSKDDILMRDLADGTR
jgi:hypothetical protein